ncbi:hypothetical protein DPEC_G00227480 [Dallia pectoralis]|uniref:Uncharacterized protein n=1 Tax=Dallia pectoralis TaxID=75939 RepID=A0ACC2G0V6_DALPE|nr:hypothetical protein DPEC_G00227480 [Dallia pectoralis]
MERCCILQWLILCILSMSECTTEVRGSEGQNVTLPCKYDSMYWGLSYACWGRGTIPTTGCTKEVISTDGTKVTNRVLSRYQLLGDLMTGDVSLTIIKTTEKDSGIYGCRVQQFDKSTEEKLEVILIIMKAPVPPTPRTPDNVTPHTWDYHTHDYLTKSSSQNLDTFSTNDVTLELNQWSHSNLDRIHTSIKLVLIGMVIASALVLRKRCKRIATIEKIPQNSGDTVGYRSSESIPKDTQVVIDNINEMTE